MIPDRNGAVIEAAEWYVYLLSKDEYYPHALLGALAKEGQHASWSFAVEITYRCLVSGIWKFTKDGWLETVGVSSVEEFCVKLSQLDPYQLSEEGAVFWLDSYMVGTDVSAGLVSKLLISDDGPDFMEGFFDEINYVFSMSGVSWEEGVLFPVG